MNIFHLQFLTAASTVFLEETIPKLKAVCKALFKLGFLPQWYHCTGFVFVVTSSLVCVHLGPPRMLASGTLQHK